MNKALLKAAMAEFGDNQNTLAAAMGISLSRLNAKINERNQAAFTQREISFIKDRYNLSNDRAIAIFFAEKVS